MEFLLWILEHPLNIIPLQHKHWFYYKREEGGGSKTFMKHIETATKIRRFGGETRDINKYWRILTMVYYQKLHSYGLYQSF